MRDDRILRRGFLRKVGVGSAALAAAGRPGRTADGAGPETDAIVVDSEPRFELSPYLYMQFMEPLGTTDGSVDAAWDFGAERWREDLIEITQVLAPTLMRWGGCFASYYRWKEGVGPRALRPTMLNQLWGGIYNNQVGTDEFLDFCERVGADALITVNFESDGRKNWAVCPRGSRRSGDAAEAAEWVRYCNGDGTSRRAKVWQIGNETSYASGGFDVETSARKTLEFARAMRASDPGIEIIGWADSGWASRVAEIAGEELQYLAFHNGFRPGGDGSPLRGIEYREDPDATWNHFMRTCESQERKLADMRAQVARYGIPLALTECHYFLPGRNRCEALSTWAAGVANARTLNVHERNGDILQIATLADFCGTRWQNNAVMIPVPRGKSHLMPVAMVMSLYRKHSGKRSLQVRGAPDGLDVTASRTGDRVWLHVVNTRRTRSVRASMRIPGETISAGRVHWFAMDSEHEVFEYRPECTFPREARLDPSGDWTFPAASVSAVELTLEAER